MNLEPLEVFALTSDMQRATGSIPYTSLMWDRKYYEPGSFLMELPANVYDPSWAYIYTDERPETGIIQKVEYSDTATTAGGVDTVILSGFFLEHELNRYTFLVEETEEEAYRIYKPAPAKTVKPTMWTDSLGQTYVKTGGSGGVLAKWETIDGDYVDPSTIDQSTLTQVELGAGEGMKLRQYETNNLDRFPTGFWTANEYTNENYSYYSEDGKTLHSVAPDGTEKTFDIVRGGTGDVIYEDSDGSLKWVNGVASSLGGTYVRARDSWESMVKSEGLEVVTGDGTIMGGSTYARAYRTVKGPWQLRTDLDVNEPADNVQRIIQWAQDIWGNNLLYDEVGFAGEEKIIDPSLKLFGDLAYEELKTIGASPRLSYSFESDTCVFEIWRGLDRTQSQAGVPAPPTSDEPEPDEPTIDELYEAVDYIQSDGGAYIDTGVCPTSETHVSARMAVTEAPSSYARFFGSRASSATRFGVFHSASSDAIRYCLASNDVTVVSPVEIGKVYTITVDGGTCDVDGTTESVTATAIDNAYSIYLLAENRVGAVADTMKGRIYSCSIEVGNSKRDFMPYRRKADGVFGLLDLVNEVFYESASGVPFTGPSYPAGTYEELDYIVATGTQYIDTGITPNQDTRVIADMQNHTNSVAGFFGARVSNKSKTYTFGTNSDKWGSGYNTATSTYGTYDGERHVIDKNKNVTSIDGVAVITATYAEFTAPGPMYIFGYNQSGTVSGPYAAKLYSMLIYGDGTTLDRDYVPRRRVSDGAVGLLDLVHGVFYESAGSEPFLAPGELPSGYTRLEYIESTGSQYIDTGIVPNIDTRITFSGYITDASALGWAFGTWDANKSDMFTFNTTPSWGFGYGSALATITDLGIGSFTADLDGNSYTLGGSSGEFSAQSFTCSHTAYLFAINAAGSVSNAKYTGLCYDVQVYGDGVNISRDYVPAKNSSGEVGLFDLVTMTFYEDAAGVGFVAGPELAAVATVEKASTFALTRTVAASDESNTAANPFAVFSDTWGTLYGFTASRDVSNYRNTCYVLYQFRDKTDADGNPIGPRGYVKARLEDELPDAETYLDLRGEEPEDDQTDEAFIESLRQRGLAHLQANYAAIESLDTGTLAGNGYLDGYDLGDKVDMLVEAIGLVKEARITGVCEVHEAGSSTATLEIGEQKLTNIRKAVIV